MRNLLGGLVLGFGSLLAPAIASADPVVIHPPVPVGYHQPVRMNPPPPVYVPAPVPAPLPAPVFGPVAYRDGGRFWERERARREMARYSHDLRRDLFGIGRDLSFDVRRGVVRPEAMRALAFARYDLERDLAAFSAKGFLTFEERAHLDRELAELRCLRDRFARPVFYGERHDHDHRDDGDGRGYGYGHDRGRFYR